MSGPPTSKFVIRSEKMRDTIMSQEQALVNWNTMKEAIRRIYAHQASSLSYEELYRTAYNLVLHKHGDLLYNGVKSITVEELKKFWEPAFLKTKER